MDPLHGYILLAEKLWKHKEYAEAWNFGPINEANRTVHDVIQSIIKLWNQPLTILSPHTNTLYESPILTLDSTKAVNKLGWTPKLSTDYSIAWTVDWYKNMHLVKIWNLSRDNKSMHSKIYKGAIKWNKKMPFLPLITNKYFFRFRRFSSR